MLSVDNKPRSGQLINNCSYTCNRNALHIDVLRLYLGWAEFSPVYGNMVVLIGQINLLIVP